MAYKDPKIASLLMKEKRLDRRSKGLCIECGKESSLYRCSECSLRKQKYKNNRSNHKCKECNLDKLSNKSRCLVHYLKDVAKTALQSRNDYILLEDLMVKQNFKCAVTNISISWGDDIEADHITPLSRGGSKDITNIRWVITPINRMKGSKTEEEFKVILEKIVRSMTAQYKP